jgi:hypothetical protein
MYGAFEGPVGDFASDDAGVGSVAAWQEQAFEEFSVRVFEGAGESAGGNAAWPATWRRTTSSERVNEIRSGS